MRRAVGHHDVTAKFALVAFGNKDAAIMRDTAGERVLINIYRGPVVVTVLVFALEGIEAAEKMNGPSGSVGAQFNESRHRGTRSAVYRPPSIGSAATGKNKRDQNYERSCDNATGFGHEAQFNARVPSVNGKLRLGKTPTMLQAA